MAFIEKRLYHEQIADVIRKEIRSHHAPGDRIASDREQATRFGVSVITVRQAMQQLCQEGLLERRHGSGTYVSEAAGRQRVPILVNGDIFEGAASYFWLKVTREIQRQLSAAGFETAIELDPKTLEDPGHIQGVMAIRATHGAVWSESLQQRSVPIISNDKHFTAYVENDVTKMIRDGTQYLIDAGCERLGVLRLGRVPVPRDDAWILGPYIETLENAGLTFHEEWAICCDVQDHVGQSWEAFRTMWQSEGEKPDALFITDDTLYQEAAMAILSLGISVPDELLVITHANTGSDVMYPFPTARLECDPVRFAATMVEMLRAGIAGETPEPEVLEFVLIG